MFALAAALLCSTAALGSTYAYADTAQDQAAQLVTKEAIYEEAKKRSEELVAQTQNRIEQLHKAGNEYMDAQLEQTEETIAKALNDVRDTRVKFRTITEAQEQQRKAAPNVEV